MAPVRERTLKPTGRLSLSRVIPDDDNNLSAGRFLHIPDDTMNPSRWSQRIHKQSDPKFRALI
jgi:hypothetical protein